MALLAPGDLVGGDWEVVGKVGVGTYSEIYEAVHVLTRQRAAVKVDRPGPRDSLAWESGILHKLQRYPFVARHYGLLDAAAAGGARPPMKALVMSLLGSNVSYLRKRQPDGLLPFGAALHAGLQMLALVEAVHAEGFIHRDVKPSNFVLAAAASGRPGGRRLCILDFGQSRVYRDDKGDVRCVAVCAPPPALRCGARATASAQSPARLPARLPRPARACNAPCALPALALCVACSPARETAEFRGTSLYSSLHAHQAMDLGRRDDLWSVLYCVVDMARGASGGSRAVVAWGSLHEGAGVGVLGSAVVRRGR